MMNRTPLQFLAWLFSVLVFVSLTLAAAAYGLGFIRREQTLVNQKDSFGNEYSGVLREGKFQGPVTIRFPGGDSYSGGFSGAFEGEGVFQSREGWICRGVFDNGKLRTAALEDSSGSYSGETGSLTLNGKGRFSAAAGWIYEGDWVNGIPEGQGTFSWPGGALYTGAFKEGYADGYGEFSSTAWSYRGQFRRGFRDGTGVLTLPDGRVMEGNWETGVFKR